MRYDIVICIGPNDYSLLPNLITNLKHNIIDYNKIYVITPKENITVYSSQITDVIFVDESIFPFSIDYISTLFGTSNRSGWYLQQLLKIYASIIITDILDNYVIIDSDVYFHKPVNFFKDDKINFNIGTEYHLPYFEHMNKLHPSLTKVIDRSGICHLMPMKRNIVELLIQMIESYKNEPFWKVFLNSVSPLHYGQDPHNSSGASEYEIMFTFTLQNFSEECVITQLLWRNTSKIDRNYNGTYEACHHYNRF
jgi:hypothetical protein